MENLILDRLEFTKLAKFQDIKTLDGNKLAGVYLLAHHEQQPNATPIAVSGRDYEDGRRREVLILHFQQ